MEKINLSTNARKIEEAYLKVVRGSSDANYVVYTVDKASVVDVEETDAGSLDDFVQNFTDGHIQFGLARVQVPGSDVFKNLLLGWCPDNAPAKGRLSFAANFAEIANVLSGYHVQVTARDQDDLDVDELLKTVSAAAGARYSIQSGAKPLTSKPIAKPTAAPTVVKPTTVAKPAPKLAPKPAAKPSYVPRSTGNPINFVSQSNDDGWGGEKEIQERDFSEKPLESVPSAYKPTKVNIEELRKQKSDTVSSTPKVTAPAKDDKEPQPASFKDKFNAYKSNEERSDGRLTSLPKPKVGNVGSRFTPSSSAPSFGAKPAVVKPTENKSDKLVGGLSRNFGAEGGKTPAQLWAEKRGKYTTVESHEPAVKSGSEEPELERKFAQQVSVNDPESEQEQEQDPEEEEEEEEEEKEETKPFEPPIIKPASSFGAPPKRNLPPTTRAAEPEKENTPEPAPAPVPLPARNLPPPPVRAAEPEPEPEPESEPEVEQEHEHQPPVTSAKPKPSAVAEYTYEKDEDNEIAFEEGDLIVEIDFVDEDWWSGKHSISGEIGLFPASYVQIKESNETSAATSSPTAAPAAAPVAASTKPTATAEYAYEKDEDNEISFEDGDLIVDIEFVDDDWWSGKHSKTGETGLFPANYVNLNN